MNRSLRLVALAIVLVVVAACGQYSGVHDTAGSFAGPGGTDGTGTDGTTAGTGGTGTGGIGTGGTGTGGTGTGGAGTGGTGTGVVQPGGPGDRTGVTPTTITIGVHAPLTGAAPIEGKAFDAGKDLYWNWLKKNGKKIYGREVKVVFADDNYTPSTAVNVCNNMAVSQRAFLLIGAAGTDQINACAQYADPRGIPYLSPGVQEAGLNSRRTYFAVTMTYKQQMPLLVQLLKKERDAGRITNKYGVPGPKLLIGHVRPNTPNFSDAATALKDAAVAAGFDYKAYTVVKDGSPQEAETVATQMQQAGVDIAIPITPPLFTIQLAIQGGKKNYYPRYAGVGISNNINQMIDRACYQNEFNDAIFFSPWPGWRNAMHYEFDPDFRKAAESDPKAQEVNKRDKGGDLLLALWGIMKTVHHMLLKAGPDPTRQGFVAALNNNFSLSLKVFPDLRYSPQNHFGAQNIHVLLGKCKQEGGDYGGGGAQWISHPNYYGLKSKF